MDIQILEKDTVWFKKIRNGCWRTMRGNKEVSEHSTRQGAENMCEKLLLDNK